MVLIALIHNYQTPISNLSKSLIKLLKLEEVEMCDTALKYDPKSLVKVHSSRGARQAYRHSLRVNFLKIDY